MSEVAMDGVVALGKAKKLIKGLATGVKKVETINTDTQKIIRVIDNSDQTHDITFKQPESPSVKIERNDEDHSTTVSITDKDGKVTNSVIKDGLTITDIIRKGETVVVTMSDNTIHEFDIKNIKVNVKEDTEYCYKIEIEYYDENGNKQVLITSNLKAPIVKIIEDANNSKYTHKFDVITYDDKGYIVKKDVSPELLPPVVWCGNDVTIEYIDDNEEQVKAQVVNIPNSKVGDFYIDKKTSYVFQRTDSLGTKNLWEFSHNSRGKGNFEIAKECGYVGDKYEWYASLLINKWTFEKPTKETLLENDLNKIIFYKVDSQLGKAWDTKLTYVEDLSAGNYYFYDGTQYIEFIIPQDIVFSSEEHYLVYNEQTLDFTCYKVTEQEDEEVFKNKCIITQEQPECTEFLPVSMQHLGKPQMICFIGDTLESSKSFEFDSLTQETSGSTQFAPGYPKLSDDNTKIIFKFLGNATEYKAQIYGNKTHPSFRGSTAERIEFIKDEVWNLREFMWFDTTLHCQMLYRKDSGYLQYKGQQVGTVAPNYNSYIAEPTEGETKYFDTWLDGTVWNGSQTVYLWNAESSYWEIVLSGWDSKQVFGNGDIVEKEIDYGFARLVTSMSDNNLSISVKQNNSCQTYRWGINDVYSDKVILEGEKITILSNIEKGILYNISLSEKTTGRNIYVKLIRYENILYTISSSETYNPLTSFVEMGTEERIYFLKKNDPFIKIVLDNDLSITMNYRDGIFSEFVANETCTFPENPTDAQEYTSDVSGTKYKWDDTNKYWKTFKSGELMELLDAMYPVGQVIMAKIPPSIGTWQEVTATTERALMIGSDNEFGNTISQALPKPSINIVSNGSHTHNYSRISNTYSNVKIDADTNWGYTGHWNTGTTGSSGSHTHTATVSTSGAYGTGSKVLMDGYFVKLWERIA